MSRDAASVRGRNLRTLAALAALFMLPLALAFFVYYGTAWRPAGHVNHGKLIAPPRALPALSLPEAAPGGDVPAATGGAAPFRGRWSLVYVGPGGCDRECRSALVVMRQTRLALNTDMTRLERVFLASGECCARDFLVHEHPGLRVLDATGREGERLLREFPTDGRGHTLYVVDPLGNLMMSYDARRDPHGLLEDLKKLLRLSHIG
jgi:hypothetical protein